MAEEFRNSKAKYKEHIKNMTDEERLKERKDIKIELMKSRIDSERGMNPYQKATTDYTKNQYNPRFLRWKLKQLQINDES